MARTERTRLASLGTVVGTDRFRVSDAMTLRFLIVMSPSCKGADNAENLGPTPATRAIEPTAEDKAADAVEI
jgi:hypothetical protein